MAIAPSNLPMDCGEPRCTRTDAAPADSPVMVIWFGSKDSQHGLHLAVSEETILTTSEPGDVGQHPVQSIDLIANAKVAFDISSWNGEKAECANSVVESHSDDIFSRGEVATVGLWVGARATLKASAVDPELDRAQVRLCACFWQVAGMISVIGSRELMENGTTHGV